MTLVTTSNIDCWRSVPMLLHLLWKSSHYPFCKSLLAGEGLYVDNFESCTNNTPLYEVIHEVLETGDKYQDEDTRSKVGIKKYKGKNCVWKEIGKRSKVGMKHVQRKKLCTKYSSYWNCLSRSFLVFVSPFLAASHGIASYTLHGIKSCEVVPYFIEWYPISLTFQISLLEMKMKLESQTKAQKQSEIILIRHHVIWYQSLVCDDNFL